MKIEKEGKLGNFSLSLSLLHLFVRFSTRNGQKKATILRMKMKKSLKMCESPFVHLRMYNKKCIKITIMYVSGCCPGVIMEIKIFEDITTYIYNFYIT